MIADLALLGAGAFLVLVALIWTAYRVIDERLGEIQADIAELHNGVAHLFLLASKSEAKPSKPKPCFAFDNGKTANDVAFLRSRGLAAELAQVDELCGKLITLVPPPEAIPLISAVSQVKAPLLPEVKADGPMHFEGRRLLLAWPKE
jgi:hypothetical protein